MPVHGQVGKELADMVFFQVFWMALAVIEDIRAYPFDVGLFRLRAVVHGAERVTHPLEKLGRLF